MAETGNIAEMAMKVSKEIFDVLGWEQVGPTDQNWKCAEPERHDKKTHPSDVVFYYDDPYRRERVLWNVDLKSYGKTSINKGKIRTAIQSLAKSVECASVSTDWQALYESDEPTWRCDGLLFVYNHDGEFSTDFAGMLTELDSDDFAIASGRRLAILGPTDIEYLVNLTSDIVAMRGRSEIPPGREKLLFWYPDLVRPKLRPQTRSAATIEAITAPWLTLQVPPEHNSGKTRFIVYYRGAGDTIDEFRYLFDSFLRLQMLSVDREAVIDVRFVRSARTASTNFTKAKQEMSNTFHGFAKTRLDNVRCASIPVVHRSFSDVEIGMEG